MTAAVPTAVVRSLARGVQVKRDANSPLAENGTRTVEMAASRILGADARAVAMRLAGNRWDRGLAGAQHGKQAEESEHQGKYCGQHWLRTATQRRSDCMVDV